MAKIILTQAGNVVREMALHKERTTIGRKSYNDLVIDSPTISGDHAVIIAGINEALLEDRNSTNGTQVNGRAVTRHALQHNDVIQMAGYKLLYIVDDVLDGKRGLDNRHEELPITQRDATITVLDGPSTGKIIALTKVLTTIGRPGMQVAIVTRRAESFELTHVEGTPFTCINDTPLDIGARPLKDGDVIGIAGSTMKFSCSSKIGA
ncbi:FHA domain-containing protein [Glaciimonas immobilis]|uniref:PSer/pThr/pTyr-binding forkhead associated (FHA) protein n=1 Tax=Glaciimonas immobilis TaxID=728004 RepID=A0A840RX25_9BURK|nr:FHA domain-containing protein [Glaciimonas immobilis]KAF3998562.1 FHA domain-containing protein [Glaciimonas immobilis]MBB5201416.1 pSer/pThr/pTyr-binding forkhead associated (FHA) protein [Glaciimonas immobilis]